MSGLKDVNNQIEFTWNQKYQDDLAKKDSEIRQLKQGFLDKEHKIDIDHKNAIAELKTQFRNDFLVVDKELTKQTNACKDAQQHNEGLKEKMEKLKDLVRAATTSEEKKSALLEEVKIAVQRERENIDVQQKEITKDKDQLAEYKRIKEEEILAIKRELDESQFRLKE